MVYTLPRDERIVLRPATDLAIEGIAKFAQLAPGWSGGSIGIVFTEQLKVARDDERWWTFDLVTGRCAPIWLTNAHRLNSGALLHTATIGHAFITWQKKDAFMRAHQESESRSISASGSPSTEHVTIHVNHWFHSQNPVRADLDVARDAWFQADIARAEAIAKRVAPHSFELFIACIKIEFERLKKQSDLEAHTLYRLT